MRLVGPRVYDLVALLCDSYILDLDLDLQNAMIERYAAAASNSIPIRSSREFWVVALHRKLKDAGRFVFIDRERSDASFLRVVPAEPGLRGARVGADVEGLEGLRAYLRERIPGFPNSVKKPAAATK